MRFSFFLELRPLTFWRELMMSNQNAISLCAATVICCCAAATFVYSQSPVTPPIPGQIQEPLSKGKIALPAPPQPPTQDGYRGVVVTTSKQLDKKLETDIATELMNLQPSVDLVKHFDPLFRNRTIRHAGWAADIESLETDGDTSAVTVRFTPIIEPRNGGSVTAVGSVDEMYELKNGKLTFLKRIAVGNPALGRFIEE